ncbi:MAG TPA: hypothetical protein P5121_01350 [Caldilineaceae bacterium]|nr:hypothetical protein [Caldilineaceae bacterium]
MIENIPSNDNILQRWWHGNPERFTWVVILASFAMFVVLLFAIPAGINYTLRYFPASQTAEFIPAENSVFFLTPPKAAEQIAITAERKIGEGDVIAATSDAAQGVLSLINDEEPPTEQVVGSVHIYAGTKLAITHLSRPFFERWSSEPYRVALRLDSGQARVFTNSGNARPLAVELSTPHGSVELASGSYQISVEESRTNVTVIDGRARLIHAKEQTITVGAGQRAWMSDNDLLEEVASATQNLITNGDFSPPALSDWTPSKTAEPNVVLGNVYFQEREGRRVAYFLRQDVENQHNEVAISQVIDKRVDIYNSLFLQMDVNILFHNLPGAGFLNTEFPLRVEVNYTDQYGKDLNWGYGFYYRDPEPPGPTEISQELGEQVPQAQWYTYRSPNLIALLDQQGTRPSRINSIRIYASGWNYQSMVSQVYLYAE